MGEAIRIFCTGSARSANVPRSVEGGLMQRSGAYAPIVKLERHNCGCL